jgi:hypothetical protein
MIFKRGEQMQQAEIFEQIYQDYLAQVAQVDMAKIKDRLGITIDGETAIIPFYGIPHRISPQGIEDAQGKRPSHAVSVILCQYILLCPENDLQVGQNNTEWVTYKDFEDASPYVHGFLNTAEKPVSQAFANRLTDLEKASQELGGGAVTGEFSSDLAVRFDALPKIPVLMLFNDQDEEFPAQCSILFQRQAEQYLDMECLAIIGMVLPEWLKKLA